MGLFGIKTRHEKVLESVNKQIQETKEFVNKIKKEKNLTSINTRIILKPNEEAFLQTDSVLLEGRSTTYYKGSSLGGGFRVTKGVYVGGSSRSGKSESKQELKEIDRGHLVLTNQKLVFTGTQENRNVPLKKIIAFESHSDAILITVENKVKKMYFTVPNSGIWYFVFQILLQSPNPHKLGDINSSVSVED